MICEFPSNEFYHGDLEAAPSVLQHFCALEGFWPSGPQCPIAFCDVVGKEKGDSSHHKVHQESKCNEAEANKIVIFNPCDGYQHQFNIYIFADGYYYSNVQMH